jgi:endonuclease/exonuclease/phosphatase (EEP) superfamily protein YafD
MTRPLMCEQSWRSRRVPISISTSRQVHRLIDHGAELMKAGVPVILAGDYNVVPAAQDTRRAWEEMGADIDALQRLARGLGCDWTR